MTGSFMSRPALNELLTRVQPNDTVVVAWLALLQELRLGREDPGKDDLGIISIKEDISMADDSATAKYLRR